jgi:DNA-nicking Smr family endonuclease
VDKKAKSEPADADLFRRALQDVVPLKKVARTVPGTTSGRASAVPGQNTGSRTRGGSGPRSGQSAPGGQCPPASFCRAGIQKRFLQKLRRGHYPPEDQLDLHTMDSAACRQAVTGFLARAIDRRMRCVRIIHGKGLHSEGPPRLQITTRQLLRHNARVLAYAPCKPAQGGDGATDILLKQA